jgi:hypothetical protein
LRDGKPVPGEKRGVEKLKREMEERTFRLKPLFIVYPFFQFKLAALLFAPLFLTTSPENNPVARFSTALNNRKELNLVFTPPLETIF